MPANLPLPDLVSQSSSFGFTNRILKSELGDGYVQRVVDGTNATKKTANVMWENLTTAEKDTVLAALSSVGSWDRITWQSPICTSVTNWVITEDGVQISVKSGEHYSISLQLVQDF